MYTVFVRGCANFSLSHNFLTHHLDSVQSFPAIVFWQTDMVQNLKRKRTEKSGPRKVCCPKRDLASITDHLFLIDTKTSRLFRRGGVPAGHQWWDFNRWGWSVCSRWWGMGRNQRWTGGSRSRRDQRRASDGNKTEKTANWTWVASYQGCNGLV